jgi:transposase-like protein
VDKNPAYPKAIGMLKKKGILAPDCELRPVKYLNNVIEEDHRFIKRRVNPGMGSDHLIRRGGEYKAMRRRTNFGKVK